MSAPTPGRPRCEVCAARLDQDHPSGRPRRCAEHVGQAVLFPLSDLPRGRPSRRRGRGTAGGDGFSPAGDRHHSTGRGTARRSRKDPT